MLLESPANTLPEDQASRNEYPIAEGCLDYFPNALAEVARLSFIATEQHHPGEDMHWDRSKSTNHADKILRHLVDRGGSFFIGDHVVPHSVAVAWRALALLQEEMEARNGLPPSRASR